MKIKIPKIKKLESTIKGLLKEYKKSIDENNKIIKDYKKNLLGGISQGKLMPYRISFNLKKSKRFEEILIYLFKGKEVKKHYTEKGLKEIIIGEVCKKINKIESLDFKQEEFNNLLENIQKKLENMDKQTYGFQILNFHYNDKNINLNNSCKIITIKKDKEKLYKTPLSNMTPGFNPLFKNFLVIGVYENDSSIALERARTIAENIIAILKIKYSNAPKIDLGDAYVVPYKDGWIKGYKSTEVLHWDPETEDRKEISKLFSIFKKHLENIDKNEMHESLSLSLIRFSSALKISIPSFKISEIIGCLESLLTSRSDAKNDGSNIVDKLIKRIKKLVGKGINKTTLGDILKEHYEVRSDYSHQSYRKDFSKKINTLVGVYYLVLEKFLEKIDKYDKKKDFVNWLDAD